MIVHLRWRNIQERKKVNHVNRQNFVLIIAGIELNILNDINCISLASTPIILKA